MAIRHTLCTRRTVTALSRRRLTRRTATPNSILHNLLTACFGCWQASNPDWDWKVYERNGSPNSSFSAAWSDSREFYDSLFANATDWVSHTTTILLKSLGCAYFTQSAMIVRAQGLLAAKHDHVQEQIPLTTIAMEELGYIGRALTAEHDGLAAHGATLMAGGYTGQHRPGPCTAFLRF